MQNPAYEAWIERRLRQWMSLHDEPEPPASEWKCLLALAREASRKLTPHQNPASAWAIASFVGTGYFRDTSPFHPYLRRYVETCQGGGVPTLGVDLTPGAPPPPTAMPPLVVEKIRSFLRERGGELPG